MTSRNYNHLKREDRNIIEDMLNIPKVSLKQIASSTGRDPKSIREEIKKHRYLFMPKNRRNKCGKHIAYKDEQAGAGKLLLFCFLKMSLVRPVKGAVHRG